MDDRYESEGRKPERERKVVHFIIQGHWWRRSLCSVFLICYCYCVGGKRMAVYQIYLIFLCVFWRWRHNVSVFHDRRVLISTCVCLSEGSAVLVRYRRSWILSESAAGGEDGALGQVPCTLILPAHVCTSSSRGDVYSRELEGVQNLNVGCY